MTIRELIMELRKIGNHDAVVQLDNGGVRDIEAIELHDLGPRDGGGTAMIVYLRTYKEQHGGIGTPLSSSRRIVWQ
jgi:hypothetical protein